MSRGIASRTGALGLGLASVLIITACDGFATAPQGPGAEDADQRVGPSLASLPDTPPQVNLAFCKDFDLSESKTRESLAWRGTVEGDVEGALTTVLQAGDAPGNSEGAPLLRIEFLWEIRDASKGGHGSFDAELAGILNAGTGSVIMDGTVTRGANVGARVHEMGRAVVDDGVFRDCAGGALPPALVDAGALSYRGTITVEPDGTS